MSEAAPYARAQELRRAFDAAFALLPATESATLEDLVAVRVADRPYALRAREISGIVWQRTLLKLPSRRSELLGLAGIRSALVPIYDLSALLGLGPSQGQSPWIALCDSLDPLGLSFHGLEGLLRVSTDSISSAAEGHGAGSATHVLRNNAEAYPIVDVGSLLRKLKGQGASAPSKER